jgi:hypothetical protein
MADSISNIPRDGVLGWIADALKTARDTGDKFDLKRMLPSIVRNQLDPTPWGAGELLMGKTPEEVDNWSYGNAPMIMPPSGTGGYVPHFKTGRAQSVADTALTAPVLSPLVRAGVALAKPAAKAGASALRTVAESALQPVPRSLAQQGAVRLKGGNFNKERLDGYLSNIGVDPKDGLNDPVRQRYTPVDEWGNKQLRNYIAKDLGSTTDPLLAVEKEYSDLHLPEGSLGDVNHFYNNRRLNLGVPIPENVPLPAHWHRQPPPNAHNAYPGNLILDRQYKALADHEALTTEPLTPWGQKAGANLYPASPKEYADELSSMGDDWNDEPSLVPEWLKKAPPETKIWGLENPHEDPHGFGHVLDYLDASTTPHKEIKTWLDQSNKYHGVKDGFDADGLPVEQSDAQIIADILKEVRETGTSMAPLRSDHMRRWKELMDAGLDMTPEQLARTSVADAVRKTAQWNKWMAEKGASEGLAKGIAGVHKEYDDGHKWVKLGLKGDPPQVKLGENGLPEGWALTLGKDGEINSSTGHPWKDGIDHFNGEIRTHPWTLKAQNEYGPSSTSYRTEAEARAAAEDLAKRGAERAHRADLDAGLNAEGDAMGHCVGVYCDEVAENGTQIFSLRDGKNQPHVTVEVSPGRPDNEAAQAWRAADPEAYTDEWNEFRRVNPRNDRNGYVNNRAAGDAFNDWLVGKGIIQRLPDEIVQIKGKGNEAPVAKYLPMVQDFVKSQQWGRVGDLGNTGLFDLTKGNPITREIGGKSYGGDSEKWDTFMKANPDVKYASKQDVLDFLAKQKPEGYAQGGSVLPRYAPKRILLARLPD